MRRIALSLGDPNGIGPEIVLKALAALHGDPALRVAVFGPPQVLSYAARALGLTHLLAGLDLRPVGELPERFAQPGLVHAAAGESAVASATAAIRACEAGEFDAVVAGPHHETAIHQAGIAFSGYPSLVARVCGLAEGSVFLMLVGAGLRIVHVTLHESVSSALARITPGLVLQATQAGVRACALLGVHTPSVGMFGINPHASEGGLFGHEDAELVAPAVRRLRVAGVRVSDPQGADVLLAARAHDLYEGASALSIGGRTLLASVGHGSAMDIAGQGVARPDALLRSLRLLSGATMPNTEMTP